jgi:septum formation protein
MYILASQSLRRVELLKQLNIEFEVIPSAFDETSVMFNEITSYVEELAYQKAKHIQQKHPHKTVIGADTVILYQNQVYGKPKDELDAYHMLKTLSGNTHYVYTGMAVLNNKQTIKVSDFAKVTFKQLTDDMIVDYIKTKEPMDKSGSYAIQGGAKHFVSHIEGDIETIIGLTTKTLKRILKEVDL